MDIYLSKYQVSNNNGFVSTTVCKKQYTIKSIRRFVSKNPLLQNHSPIMITTF